ncbi:hypothetical protein [Serratia symbiotica]|uniref:hypothetical protein n=1 Tax=Serratia symbiotica TaxID=138074 RepID=UPI0030CE8E2A
MANIVPTVYDALAGTVNHAEAALAGRPADYTSIGRFELPESMKPTDPYAQLAAEMGPYLITGLGAERTAAATSGRAERLATQAATLLAENTPGALSQGTQNHNLVGNLAGSAIGRGIVAGGGRIAGVLRDAVPREGRAAVPVAEPDIPDMKQVAVRVGAVADHAIPANMAETAKDVAPRQEVIDAARQLGLSEEDLLLSHVSGNAAYRDFEQALKSVPGSQLAAQENQALAKIAKRASTLTDAAGALPDKAAMNDNFLSSFQRGIAKVQSKSDQLYNQITTAIPKGQPVEAQNIIRYLDRKADELWGAEYLSTKEKQVYNAVAPAGPDATVPTYARLDTIRKQMWQAIGKKHGAIP